MSEVRSGPNRGMKILLLNYLTTVVESAVFELQCKLIDGLRFLCEFSALTPVLRTSFVSAVVVSARMEKSFAAGELLKLASRLDCSHVYRRVHN